jgi:hypothetical protein
VGPEEPDHQGSCPILDLSVPRHDRLVCEAWRLY